MEPAKDQVNRRKRQREIPSVNVELVEIYEDLSNESPEIRTKAAHALLSRFTADKNAAPEDVDKAIRRLFRGLCSGRKAARLGFSVALTELLSILFERKSEQTELEHDLDNIFNVWGTTSAPEGSMSRQEKREYHFGRLFGAGAIINSGILFKPGVDRKYWVMVLTRMIDITEKKTSLREECGWIVYSALNKEASKGTFMVDDSFAQEALHLYCSNNLAYTPEGIAIWLSLQSRPGITLPKEIWYGQDPLHIKESSRLGKFLSESGKEGAAPQKGSWNSKLHFVWNVILDRFFCQDSKSNSEASKTLSFADFWLNVVDGRLFEESASPQRKHWGFLLFSLVLQQTKVPVESLPNIFSANLIRCLTNQVASEERLLHKMAVYALKALEARVKQQHQSLVPIVTGLLGPVPSPFLLKQLAKKKTLENLMAAANSDGLEDVVSILEEHILHPGTKDEATAKTVRQILAEMLVAIVRQQKTTMANASESESFPWLEKTWKFFALNGYFKNARVSADDVPTPPLLEASQTLFRSKLIAILTHLMNITSDPARYPSDVILYIRKLEKGDNGLESIIEDGLGRDSVNAAEETLKKMINPKKTHKHSSPSERVLIALFALTTLQVYHGDPDSIPLLEELKEIRHKLRKASRKSNDDPEASEMLVEILLGLASRPSQLFRQLSSKVFAAFANQITPKGLESMFRVLQTEESVSGQNELFEEEFDDSDVEEGEDDASDVEMIDADNANSESDGDSDENSSDGEHDDTDEIDEATLALEEKLAAALGTRRAGEGVDATAGSDHASDLNSDSDMNDEEMEALEPSINQFFQERQKLMNRKKEKKDAKENIVNFKLKVLDFLHVYVKERVSSAQALRLVLPLLKTIRTTKNKQVSDKASNIAREYARLSKGKSVPVPDDPESTWSLLLQVHEEARMGNSKIHGSACSQLSMLIVRALLGCDWNGNFEDESFVRILDIYKNLWEMKIRGTIPTVMISGFEEWCASVIKVQDKDKKKRNE